MAQNSFVKFKAGQHYTVHTGALTAGNIYYEENGENSYFITTDTTRQSGKTYYVKNNTLTTTSNLQEGNIYFAVDPNKKTGTIYYDYEYQDGGQVKISRIIMGSNTTPTIFDRPVTFQSTSQIIMNNINNALYSKDNLASIYTHGGIAVTGTLATTKVRIDDGLGTAINNGHGCEMIYNSTQKCLEFTFN